MNTENNGRNKYNRAPAAKNGESPVRAQSRETGTNRNGAAQNSGTQPFSANAAPQKNAAAPQKNAMNAHPAPHAPQKAPKSGKKTAAIVILAILLVVVTVVAVVLGFLLKSAFTKPSASKDTEVPFNVTPVETEDVPETEDPDKHTGNGSEFDATITPDVYNFLLVGKDKDYMQPNGEMHYSYNTDTIMLVNLDLNTMKISVLQIPRDTYVELNGSYYKINAMYQHFFNEGSKKNVENRIDYAMKSFCDMLQTSLCIKIHYYAYVDLGGFIKLVDAIGGVDVEVPFRMKYDDAEQGLHIDLEAGFQHLDGSKAEQFVRFRQGNDGELDYLTADIGRQDAQKNFMAALLAKIKSSFGISTVTSLVDIALDNITTNVSLSDSVYFARQLLAVDMNDIRFIGFPGHDVPPAKAGDPWFYAMYRRNMISLINGYFNIYKSEITDAIFDPSRIYTSTTRFPQVNDIYTSALGTDGKVYTADEIKQNPIKIPTY